MNTTTTTATAVLPEDFGQTWVEAMLATVLGSATSRGAATALGDLDRQAGDGDFGTNLTSAFKRVQAEVAATDPADYTAWLTAVSRGFLGTGGTSGPLFGMFFRELARCTEQRTPTVAELSAGLSAGVATVQRYGKAEVGHKTMVDALVPAATALADAVAAGADDALRQATQAAQQGARSTSDIVAKRGRASYVGEVARGVLDPGAVAAALMVQCADAAAAGRSGAVDTRWAQG